MKLTSVVYKSTFTIKNDTFINIIVYRMTQKIFDTFIHIVVYRMTQKIFDTLLHYILIHY